jgi:hypothetical protein
VHPILNPNAFLIWAQECGAALHVVLARIVAFVVRKTGIHASG